MRRTPPATNATTAGSAAISKVTYVTATGSVAGTSPLLLTASCPAGTTVIGGGGNVADEDGAFFTVRVCVVDEPPDRDR